MTLPKLTEAQKAKCIQAYLNGTPRKELAERFSASVATIGQILINAGHGVKESKCVE